MMHSVQFHIFLFQDVLVMVMLMVGHLFIGNAGTMRQFK